MKFSMLFVSEKTAEMVKDEIQHAYRGSKDCRNVNDKRISSTLDMKKPAGIAIRDKYDKKGENQRMMVSVQEWRFS